MTSGSMDDEFQPAGHYADTCLGTAIVEMAEGDNVSHRKCRNAGIQVERHARPDDEVEIRAGWRRSSDGRCRVRGLLLGEPCHLVLAVRRDRRTDVDRAIEHV